MSQNTSIIIASLISAGAVVITVIVNESFHALRDKRMKKERFFYEIFPLRVKAYQEMMGTIAKLGAHNMFTSVTTPYKLSGLFQTFCDSIADLCYRNIIVTSKDVADSLRKMGVLMARYSYRSLDIGELADDQGDLVKQFRADFEPLYHKLIERVRTETGIHIIEKELKDFASVVNKKQEKVRKGQRENRRKKRN